MTKEIKKVMNLDNPIPEDSLNGYLFSNENKGHKFIISCTKGGELQTLTGSVTVRFMRANNTTILLGQGGSDGRENYAQIVDGNAEVTLHPDCYNVPGRFKISVFNISGDTVSCIYVGVGTVSRTQNGELIDSGDIVPSIDELVGYIDDCITATENAEAAADHAVRYDVVQTLTDTQKAQARTNIDASSQSDVVDLKSAFDFELYDSGEQQSIATVPGSITSSGGNTSSDSYKTTRRRTSEYIDAASGALLSCDSAYKMAVYMYSEQATSGFEDKTDWIGSSYRLYQNHANYVRVVLGRVDGQNFGDDELPPITVVTSESKIDKIGSELAYVSGDVDVLSTDVERLNIMVDGIYNIDRFAWASLGTSQYPYGWSSGYYAADTGEAKSSGAFMKTYSNKFIDLAGIRIVKAVPPEGYAIAVTLFKEDGTVETIGQANTQTHPENIDKTLWIDATDYSKCVVSVGRFANSGDDTGGVHCQDAEFVSSIILDLYSMGETGVKSYYQAELKDTIEKVKAAQTEPNLIFPLVTDIHYLSVNSFFDDCIDNMKAFCNEVKCDFLLNLGDNTDGDQTSEITIERNLYMLRRFGEIGLPYYQAIGNHDTNKYKAGETLTSGQIFESYLSDTKGVVYDLTQGEKNYYIDFDNLGLRLVVLDADHDDAYAYSSRTASWLTETALNTDHVVILAEHLSSITSQNWNNGSPANHTAVTAALQAFVNNGGALIQLCGHSHADYHFTTPWLTVFSTCQKFESTDTTAEGYQRITGYAGTLVSPTRTLGTATEDSWSVVIVKPISRTICLFRFGAGEDRVFTY